MTPPPRPPAEPSWAVAILWLALLALLIFLAGLVETAGPIAR